MEYTRHFEFGIKELDDAGTFEGYASTFGNVDLQGDKVMRGAFTETLKASKGKVPFLMGHIIARIVGFGTHAEEDEKGLLVRGEFTLDSDEGRNAYATARHAQKIGHKLGLSIGYGIRDGGAVYDSASNIRKLTALDLYEYSLAAVPANTRARMRAVKSDGNWTEREFEEYLREAGLSREAAKRFILGGYSALDRRDADEGEQKRAAQTLLSELRDLHTYITLKGI